MEYARLLSLCLLFGASATSCHNVHEIEESENPRVMIAGKSRGLKPNGTKTHAKPFLKPSHAAHHINKKSH